MELDLDSVAVVSSFTGDGYGKAYRRHCVKGNAHLVVFLKNEKHFQLGASLSHQIEPLILVMLYNEEILKARFFHYGNEVKRCGSGSIAAAKTLVKLFPKQDMFQLSIPTGSVTIGKKGAYFFYQTEILAYAESACLKVWQNVINRPLVTAVSVGTPDDYCILQLDNEKALAQCSISVQRLHYVTKRAIIVTAKSDHSGADYVMRYFNPRGGQYEDSATGSANAILANFWQTKLRKKIIRGRQLSPKGGKFLVKKLGVQQRVFGEAKNMPMSKQLRDMVMEVGHHELGFD